LEFPPPSHQTGGPVYVRPVVGPLQFAQHLTFTHNHLPSSIQRVPQVAEGRFAVPGRRCRLARPPSMGNAGHQSLIPRGQQVFTRGGQFINTAESPSSSFLSDLQTTMAGPLLQPTWHNSAPAPSALPEELLLARFVLVRRDGAQPLLSPAYDRPYQVLEWSTHFFLLKIGDRTDKISTLRLKAARTLADTEPAKPLCRGRTVAKAPPVRAPPPSQRGRPRQVTFSLPPTSPPTTSSTSASSRPLRNARPPTGLNL
jgi:hypothetical protein